MTGLALVEIQIVDIASGLTINVDSDMDSDVDSHITHMDSQRLPNSAPRPPLSPPKTRKPSALWL